MAKVSSRIPEKLQGIMKSRYSEKKVNELAEKASALGYQLVNLSERFVSRTGTLACAYSLIKDIEKFLAL